jgi:hypothetical protein
MFTDFKSDPGRLEVRVWHAIHGEFEGKVFPHDSGEHTREPVPS